MISHRTAAGQTPASRARSQHASVCPARARTPPGCATKGKTWPGWTTSSGRAPGAVATRMVCARSAAEIPVVTPWAASIETGKLVPCSDRFIGVIGARPSCRARSSVIGMHTRPRPNLAMKLTMSGVMASAATTRAPSVSRCSSSTNTAIRPALSSAMISVIGLTEEEGGAEPDEARALSMACSFGAVILAWSGKQRAMTTLYVLQCFASAAASVAFEHVHCRCEERALRIGKLGKHAEVMFARNEKRPVMRSRTTTRPAFPQASALANELLCLVLPRCQQQRRVHSRIEMDRTDLARASQVEAKIAVERHVNQRLEIEHAADRYTTDDRIGRRSARHPVGREHHRRQMASRRVSADDQTRRWDAVDCALPRQPPDGLPTLFRDGGDADAGTEIVVDDRDADAFGDEWRRDEGVVFLVQGAPIATVNKQQCATRALRRKEIDGLFRPGAIANIAHHAHR